MGPRNIWHPRDCVENAEYIQRVVLKIENYLVDALTETAFFTTRRRDQARCQPANSVVRINQQGSQGAREKSR